MIVALLLQALAALSMLGAFAVGKVKLGLIGAVPWAIRLFWLDSQLLVAALVFPTINIGLGGSQWATPYKLMLSLAILRVIWNRQLGQRLRAPPMGITAAYSMLLLYAMILEITSSFDPFLAVFNDGASSLLMLAIMAQLVRGPSALKSLLQLVNVATFLQLAAVIFELVQHGNEKRCLGLSGQPNLLGISLGSMLPISLGAALSSTSKAMRIQSGLAVAGGLYAIMASGSRGGMVAALAGAVSILVLASRSLGQIFVRIAVGVFLMFAVTPIAPKMYEERILSTVADSTSAAEDRTSGRAGQIDEIVTLIQKQSVFGEGMGSYLDYAAKVRLGRRTLPHSSFMGIAVAWGILTALMWTLVQLSSIRASLLLRGRLGQDAWYANGLIGALLSSFFSSLSSPAYFSASLWALVFLSHVLLQVTPRMAGSHPVSEQKVPVRRPRGPEPRWRPTESLPTTHRP